MKKAWIALLALMAGCACVARDDARQVWLAASDSRPAAKATADYVCTGTNDELVIQQAIDDCAAESAKRAPPEPWEQMHSSSWTPVRVRNQAELGRATTEPFPMMRVMCVKVETEKES